MSYFDPQDVPVELTNILKLTGSDDFNEAMPAQRLFAKAAELPLRQGLLLGDILQGIYQTIPFAPGAAVEFPLDFLAPGTEREHIAYTCPNHGRIPERSVEGDYVQVPTYDIASSIDWNLKYSRDARWDIVSRAMEVLEAGFVKKLNDDGWHTLLAAIYDRNIMVYDGDAAQGQFTKRVVSLMKTIMRRNGGGNSTTINRFKLTDMYVSPEAIEDMRNWNIDQVDEFTRREIYLAADGTLNKVFNVVLHDLDELGVGQEYDNYFQQDLAASIQPSDVELIVGLDLSRRSFMMPVRAPVQVFEDPALHRQRRAGWYGFGEFGFLVSDNRCCLGGSI